MMSSMLVMFSGDSAVKIVFALLIAAFSGRTYCMIKPMMYNNKLAEITQWQIMLMFLCGLLLKVGANSEFDGTDDNSITGILMGVILFGGPFVVALLGLWEWQDHATAHRKTLAKQKAWREGRVYEEKYCCGLLKKKKEPPPPELTQAQLDNMQADAVRAEGNRERTGLVWAGLRLAEKICFVPPSLSPFPTKPNYAPRAIAIACCRRRI